MSGIMNFILKKMALGKTYNAYFRGIKRTERKSNVIL